MSDYSMPMTMVDDKVIEISLLRNGLSMTQFNFCQGLTSVSREQRRRGYGNIAAMAAEENNIEIPASLSS